MQMALDSIQHKHISHTVSLMEQAFLHFFFTQSISKRQLPGLCNPIHKAEKHPRPTEHCSTHCFIRLEPVICFSWLVINLSQVINFMKLFHITLMKSCHDQAPATLETL